MYSWRKTLWLEWRHYGGLSEAFSYAQRWPYYVMCTRGKIFKEDKKYFLKVTMNLRDVLIINRFDNHNHSQNSAEVPNMHFGDENGDTGGVVVLLTATL